MNEPEPNKRTRRPRRTPDFEATLAGESSGEKEVRRQIRRVVFLVLFAFAAAFYQIVTSK
jgi:hypothetical protein